MKKYFTFHIYISFCIQYFKKCLKHRLALKSCNFQVIFQPHLAQVFWMTENLQKEISTLESLYGAPLDTQELEYSESEMSSCSTDDRSESSSNESINLHFSKLKQYDLKPVCKPRIFSSESELESEVEEQGRIGKTDWCQCGECKPMTTYTESLCCQDTNEVPEELFEGQKLHYKIKRVPNGLPGKTSITCFIISPESLTW